LKRIPGESRLINKRFFTKESGTREIFEMQPIYQALRPVKWIILFISTMVLTLELVEKLYKDENK